MKIVAIDNFLLVVPYRTEGGLHSIAGRPSAGLTMLLVRLRCDDGAEGWGEAFGHAVAASTRTALETLVAPVFIARDPSDIPALMQEAQRRLHIFGRTGPVMYALSGIDIALWDLAGKRAGKPLHALLGGTARRDFPAYASLLRGSDADATARSSAAALAQGYGAVKLHEVGLPAVQAARGVVGPDIPLMLDTNCPWTVEEALRMAEALRPCDLHWLEEPLWPPEDHAGLARVRAAGAVTAAGENVAGWHGFRDMLAQGAVAVAQPSVCKIGGITEMLRVFSLGAEAGVRIVPHCGYLGAGFLATLHLTASLPAETYVERLAIALEESPFGEWVEPRSGRVRLPDGPGLGCDPAPALLARYSVAGPP